MVTKCSNRVRPPIAQFMSWSSWVSSAHLQSLGVSHSGQPRLPLRQVLFELIGSRYERRSMLITANQPFGEWGKVFPDQAMTLAAIDRLVHHSTIFEMNVESYRRRAALDRKRGPGRPPTHATIKEKG